MPKLMGKQYLCVKTYRSSVKEKHKASEALQNQERRLVELIEYETVVRQIYD